MAPNASQNLSIPELPFDTNLTGSSSAFRASQQHFGTRKGGGSAFSGHDLLQQEHRARVALTRLQARFSHNPAGAGSARSFPHTQEGGSCYCQPTDEEMSLRESV